MSDIDRGRKAIAVFEDLTTPEQRGYGVYLIRSKTADFSRSFTGSYRQARRLARSRTQYGEMELSFLEPIETPPGD